MKWNPAPRRASTTWERGWLTEQCDHTHPPPAVERWKHDGVGVNTDYPTFSHVRLWTFFSATCRVAARLFRKVQRRLSLLVGYRLTDWVAACFSQFGRRTIGLAVAPVPRIIGLVG